MPNNQAWALEQQPLPLFARSFEAGRLTLSEGAGRIYVLSKSEGTLSRLDPKTGNLTIRLSGLNHPQDMAVGRFGNRVLVDLDSSRTLLIVPSDAAGPPLLKTVGLNPGQILGGADNRYYLIARAVHILYALDPDRYSPQNWMAVGEAFRRVNPGMEKHLWLPLNQSDAIMEVGTDPLTPLRTIDLDRCIEPVRALPLSKKGFVVGCHNAILKNDGSGQVTRIALKGRFRRGVRDMLMLPGRKRFISLFHKCNQLVFFNVDTMKNTDEIPLPFRPIHLYIFPNWPILFAVMNDPDHDKTWLFGYPLSILPHVDSGFPITSISRKNT